MNALRRLLQSFGPRAPGVVMDVEDEVRRSDELLIELMAGREVAFNVTTTVPLGRQLVTFTCFGSVSLGPPVATDRNTEQSAG